MNFQILSLAELDCVEKMMACSPALMQELKLIPEARNTIRYEFGSFEIISTPMLPFTNAKGEVIDAIIIPRKIKMPEHPFTFNFENL